MLLFLALAGFPSRRLRGLLSGCYSFSAFIDISFRLFVRFVSFVVEMMVRLGSWGGSVGQMT